MLSLILCLAENLFALEFRDKHILDKRETARSNLLEIALRHMLTKRLGERLLLGLLALHRKCDLGGHRVEVRGRLVGTSFHRDKTLGRRRIASGNRCG